MFKYFLPPDLIAARPVSGERDHARLLVSGASDELQDKYVYDLPAQIEPGTLLLLNDTKVLSCRFFPEEIVGSEIFLVSSQAKNHYRALARPKKKFKTNLKFQLSPSITALVVKDDPEIILELSSSSNPTALEKLIELEGNIPIPPYIRKGRSDADDHRTYQTVFALNPGSVAAPTASLHFTKKLLTKLETNGVIIKFLTLHVGLHSILPLARQLDGDASTKKVEPEEFMIPEETLAEIVKAKKNKTPIMAVGTTVTRAVESLTDAELAGDYDFKFRPSYLFIQPGFKFRVLDRLMTNFHLSGSTHLSLVSAFHGEEKIKKVYQHAVDKRYRFYSYGDSMLLDKQTTRIYIPHAPRNS